MTKGHEDAKNGMSKLFETIKWDSQIVGTLRCEDQGIKCSVSEDFFLLQFQNIQGIVYICVGILLKVIW